MRCDTYVHRRAGFCRRHPRLFKRARCLSHRYSGLSSTGVSRGGGGAITSLIAIGMRTFGFSPLRKPSNAAGSTPITTTGGAESR